eukprot:TRINITY_DN34964_c0_g1_i1.p1 TRINITY_DN34964_c0_g1~~TRINITY_DN34964_c0_g1_i1.p1  ORF type:complete len:404 (-),score=64.81 TRINITY_DN34964_c0_g1_i1:166-1377(-)
MTKQRKLTKQGAIGSVGGYGDTAKWVAKKPAGDQPRGKPAGCGSASTDASNSATASVASEPSLEEFRSQWQSLPVLEGASNTDYYFNSYAHFGIHKDMLRDQVRTGSYMKAISNSAHLFKGKTVLDVGSGTGILCLFAATFGAKRCIGVECSDIVDYAKVIAEQNGFGETITYVRGRLEEVELPVEEVDIIISEWMGYFLIYESMLDSVLFARDKWLKKGGHLFPDRAKLYMAAIEDGEYKEEKIGFWGNLWGFDFSPMKEIVIQEPISDIVELSAVATTTCTLVDLDLSTVRREDLDFCVPYSLKVTRKDFLHAFAVWFDVSFNTCSPPVVLSTAPGKTATHWKQTVVYFDEAVPAFAGEELCGLLAVRKSKQNPRDLDLKISRIFKGVHAVPCRIQYYKLR